MKIPYYTYARQRMEDGLSEQQQWLRSFGAKCSILMDRLAYAEYRLDQVEIRYQQLIALVQGLIDERNERRTSPNDDLDEWLNELQRLNDANALFLRIIGENDPQQYDEWFTLGEQFFIRLMRINQLLLDPSIDHEAYVTALARLAEAFLQDAEHFEWLVLRQFYRAIQSEMYETVSSICLASDFLRTVSVLLTSIHSDQLSLQTAPTGIFLRSYPIHNLCAFGASFDFRDFDDDQAPLMPEVADLLNW